MRKYLAEFIGTMVLVLMGCGAAVFAGVDSQVVASVGTLGVAFAFGLSVIAMAYTIGKISGCHINPAISLGMVLSGKMSVPDFIGYIISQFAGAFLGSWILYILAFGLQAEGLSSVSTYTGANSYNIGTGYAFLAEGVFTFIFVLVVLGSTSQGAHNKFAGLAIGLALVLVHIVCIPITGTSVNPARSLAPAVFQGGQALSQVWLFIVAPFAGAIAAAIVWKIIDTNPSKTAVD